MSKYYNPVRIIESDNWLLEVTKTRKELSISSPIIITTPGNRKRLNIDLIFEPEIVYSDFGSNPDFKNCKDIIAFCQKKIFDGVIVIGGGSAMDLAKVAMAYLSLEKIDIYDLIGYEDDYINLIPSIFIPTTHGTGSEVTMWGTIWNMEGKKYSISNPSLYPKVAILDGSLSLSLPMDISIITTMDALSHSFESIWNKNANDTSNNLAISAICSILKNLPILKETPFDLKIRNKLLKASTIAGLAFSNTKTAASHSISYPLTIHYGIPHGLASSICLLPLLNINGHLIESSLNQICEKNEITMNELKQNIKDLPSQFVPYSLNEWGISEDDLPKLAKESFTKGRMDNNIVDLSVGDVLDILKKVYYK
tara:strand:+ start:30380 stop:31480 length:1101 start_codon:yes stop_codon:yes gene_type:complete